MDTLIFSGASGRAKTTMTRYGRLYSRVGIEIESNPPPLYRLSEHRGSGSPQILMRQTIGFVWAKGEGGVECSEKHQREASPIIIVSIH